MKTLKLCIPPFYSLAFFCSLAFADIEEDRVQKISTEIENILSYALPENVQMLTTNCSNDADCQKIAKTIGRDLWQHFRKKIQDNATFDDRELYWNRLNVSKALKALFTSNSTLKNNPNRQQSFLDAFETASRGIADLEFTKHSESVNKKVLITGFDPFLLDRNIKQSNPSGVIALMLDGKTFSIDGTTFEIQSVVIPVRFSDFDLGLIEKIVTPFYRENELAMLVTVSMGRSDFDLERYPGLRRSSVAPDNNNVYTGASSDNPLKPNLGDTTLSGPEFIEFSLPANRMKTAAGPYSVNDNGKVSFLENAVVVNLDAQSIEELENKTSVSGSGGGYLSNEISYRTLRVRQKESSSIPTGHVHTPRIKDFDKVELAKIYNQFVKILTKGLSEL